MSWLSILGWGAKAAGLGARVAGLSIVNPWVILIAVGVLATASVTSGRLGYNYATAQCKSAEADRRALADEIRTANLEIGRDIATRTEAAIGKIRIVHETVIQPEIRHEREIHKVLQDPTCALPDSTRILLNRARGHIERSGPAGGEPPDRLRTPARLTLWPPGPPG